MTTCHACTFFSSSFLWWPTCLIPMWQRCPSLERTRTGCGSNKCCPDSRSLHLGAGFDLLGPKCDNPTASHAVLQLRSCSCSGAPASSLPALLCPPSNPRSRAKRHRRELCSWKSNRLSARTSHHVINVLWQEKHHWERLSSLAQGHGCALHRGCAEPASGSIQFPDPFLACP